MKASTCYIQNKFYYVERGDSKYEGMAPRISQNIDATLKEIRSTY